MDLYFNPNLIKYSYTLIKRGERVLGWDNARYYPDLANFPHHMHEFDGRVEPSGLSGNPERDLEQVRRRIEEFFEETVG
ncbi:MAG TPA: DUF6516 family protein [Anaerolineae bacterium]|nr:DUF6516 family protein [Anaerolineae bacterium]